MATSLYIHIPFCKSKCSFCSFVVAIEKQSYGDAYLQALAQEAGHYRGTAVETIYIGGGTPTFLNHQQLKYLVGIIDENFEFRRGCELTIEANPENIDLQKAELLKSLGVNRVSLGVQSLNEKYLKFLHRNHSRDQAIKAFEGLRQAGFNNINLDLMFAFPGQSLDELKADLEAITHLGSEHLSIYNLTIEEGTRFFKQNIRLDHDGYQAEQYRHVIETLEHKGLRQYEISNFAKKGFESDHNSIYWQGGDYIGLGVGAHSHFNGERFWNTPSLTSYISQAKENLKPIAGKENLTAKQRLIETLLFGLRMTEGIGVSKLEHQYGCRLPDDKQKAIEEFIRQEFLQKDGAQLKTTLQGRLVLDEICSRLI